MLASLSVTIKFSGAVQLSAQVMSQFVQVAHSGASGQTTMVSPDAMGQEVVATGGMVSNRSMTCSISLVLPQASVAE